MTEEIMLRELPRVREHRPLEGQSVPDMERGLNKTCTLGRQGVLDGQYPSDDEDYMMLCELPELPKVHEQRTSRVEEEMMMRELPRVHGHRALPGSGKLQGPGKSNKPRRQDVERGLDVDSMEEDCTRSDTKLSKVLIINLLVFAICLIGLVVLAWLRAADKMATTGKLNVIKPEGSVLRATRSDNSFDTFKVQLNDFDKCPVLSSILPKWIYDGKGNATLTVKLEEPGITNFPHRPQGVPYVLVGDANHREPITRYKYSYGNGLGKESANTIYTLEYN